MIKFKYFYDSTRGTPSEDEVNKWLSENNITIINTSINNGCLAIFYKEEMTLKEMEDLEKVVRNFI